MTCATRFIKNQRKLCTFIAHFINEVVPRSSANVAFRHINSRFHIVAVREIEPNEELKLDYCDHYDRSKFEFLGRFIVQGITVKIIHPHVPVTPQRAERKR